MREEILNKSLSLFESKIFGTKFNFNDFIAKLCAISGSSLKIKDLIEKFNKWGLYASVIGEVIGTNEVIISHKGKIVAQIPTSALSDDTPVNVHNVINNPPDDLLNKWEWKENDLPEIHEQKIFSLKENKEDLDRILSASVLTIKVDPYLLWAPN